MEKAGMEKMLEELPKKVYQMPPDLEELFDTLPIEVSPRWLGQRIRKGDMWVEFGGPKHEYTSFILIRVHKDPEEIEDGRVTVIGKDLNEMEIGSSYPIGYYIDIAGEELDETYGGYFERTTMDLHDRMEGLMWLNTRDTQWWRLHKEIKGKIDSLKYIAQGSIGLTKSIIAYVDAMEIKYVIPPPTKEGYELIKYLQKRDAESVWKGRDALIVDIHDEDVDIFYGCTLCQSFAPNHMCIIAPDRTPFCGVINWVNARVAIEVDPEGYMFYTEKGECIDSLKGVYSGAQRLWYERSNATLKKVNMYCCIQYPQTSCGCFESIAFYIPEVDGIGMANRAYTELTPLGLPFSKLAAMSSGGVQSHGFVGLNMLTIKSKKFLQGEGSWDRIVWRTKYMKEKLVETIPETHYELIPTDEDTKDPEELKKMLKERKHPIVEKFWKNGEPVPMKVPPPGHMWPGDEDYTPPWK